LRELTIRQLRALAVVQKHRSVTAAAKQLHLTQPQSRFSFAICRRWQDCH
jgi:DNA-binding transcriptional LysR family regulator